MNLPRIPFEAFVQRAKRAREVMDRLDIDVLLATPSVNFRYLTGCPIPRSERFVGLLFRREAIPTIVVPAFEREGVLSSPLKMKVETWRDGEDPMGTVRKLIGDAPGISVGLEPRTDFSVYMRLVRAVPEVRWVDGAGVFERLRAEKSMDEIACTEAAVRLTEEVFARVPAIVREGMTERELAETLIGEMNGRGGEGSWAGVQFGENAAVPHAAPGRRALATGDLILIDIGTLVDGYHSDLTRVFAFRRADDLMRNVYQIVRDAQAAAFETVAPDQPAEGVDAAARDVIDRHEFGIHFYHRTGHGTGLDGHEPPYLVRGNRQLLCPGMILTLEPGIYLSGRFGIRIEDQVLLTPTRARRLSSSPEELPVIGGGGG